MARWLPNHVAHCGEDLPQLLSHQRHLEVSFCVAALSKTTFSTTNNFDKLSKTTWQQQIKTKLFCSTWISTQCSWAGANSWLLPVPSQDRGEHFEQSTKSSTREMMTSMIMKNSKGWQLCQQRKRPKWQQYDWQVDNKDKDGQLPIELNMEPVRSYCLLQSMIQVCVCHSPDWWRRRSGAIGLPQQDGCDCKLLFPGQAVTACPQNIN